MTINITKPAINVREKLSELDKPTGIAGEAMLRAETPQEQFNLIGAGRRNMIINGAMRVAQRGTSFTSTGYTLDRWKWDTSGTDQLAVTVSQSSSGNEPAGFDYSLKVDVTTAESATNSNEYARFIYQIEGQDLQHLAYGKTSITDAEPLPITLSFWVRSSVCGTYAVNLYQFDGADMVGSTYTITHPDTWEYKTVTFAGNPLAKIANDNTAGLLINFHLLIGSDFTSSNNTEWGTYTSAKFGYGHTAPFGASTDDDWYITGVQLELGKVATPFEHRSYGEELALCQRYYWRHVGETVYQRFAQGGAVGSTTADSTTDFPVIMRVVPTFSTSGASSFALYSAGALRPVTSFGSDYSSVKSFTFTSGCSGGGLVSGNSTALVSNNTTGNWIAFDAEL